MIMSTELFIGVKIQPDVLAISVLEGQQEYQTLLPHTAVGWQAMLSLLCDFAPTHQVAVAIGGQQAVELALQLPENLRIQVFVVAARPGQATRELAIYAKHAA